MGHTGQWYYDVDMSRPKTSVPRPFRTQNTTFSSRESLSVKLNSFVHALCVLRSEPIKAALVHSLPLFIYVEKGARSHDLSK